MYNNCNEAVTKFEVKGNPVPIPITKIVEAFGDRKCPKLVEQAADGNLDVRVNALLVLCDEIQNPYSIFGIIQSGAIGMLAAMCNDADYTTRLRASRALATIATDANGLLAILEEDAIPLILKGMSDPAESVRENIYNCLMHCTRTAEGVDACCAAGVTQRFTAALPLELPRLKSILLKSLHNICTTCDGLEFSLSSGAVKVCINLLSSTDIQVRINAARTLGFICFSDQAKEEALLCSGVPALCNILGNPDEGVDCKIVVSSALMAITTTDEGKRQMNNAFYVTSVCTLLNDDNVALRLNCLKIISNMAVYPAIREIMKEDTGCVSLLRRLKTSENKLISKHSSIALSAVTIEH